MPLRTFEDSVVIMIGALSPVAAALAKELIRQEAGIVIIDHNEPWLEFLSKELGGRDGTVVPRSTQLDMHQAITLAIGEVYQQYGRLDHVLIDTVRVAQSLRVTGVDQNRALESVKMVTQVALDVIQQQRFGRVELLMSAGRLWGAAADPSGAQYERDLLGFARAKNKADLRGNVGVATLTIHKPTLMLATGLGDDGSAAPKPTVFVPHKTHIDPYEELAQQIVLQLSGGGNSMFLPTYVQAIQWVQSLRSALTGVSQETSDR